jgi:type II secretory pathway component PulC
MGCIVVCGGDVDVGRINGCLIIARGNVRATEGDVRGIIVSGGKVTGEEVLGYVHAKGGIDAKSTRSQDLENVLTAKHNEREREMAAFRPPQFKTPAVLTRTAASNPFPYVRFFELTQLGMETADGPDGAAISAIKVESVAERIGLQRGDCLLSVNGQPAKSQAELRELLRRALVRDGKAEIEYDRRGLKRATQLIHFLGKNASIPR